MSLQVWLPLNGSIENQGLNGNISVINTNVTFDNTGKIGQAAVFNGTTSRLSINNFSIGNNWSYGFWFYSTSTNRAWESLLLLSNNSGDTDTQLGFYIHTTQTRMQSTANGQYNSNIPYTYTGKWTHMFATFNGTTLITYINGIEVDRKTITAALLSRTHLVIGARSASTNGGQESATTFFAGKINDVRVYDHCLSQKEVEEISKGLVLHYKFNTNNIVNKNLLSNFDTSFLSYNIGATTLFSNQMNSGVQEIVANIAGAEKCLHLHSNGGQNRVYRTMSVSQGKIYTLSLDYYSATAKTKAQFGQLHGGDYTAWPETNSSNYTTPGAWQRLTYTFGPPTSDTKLYFYILCDNGADCYIKNIKIEEGSVMTPYINSSTNIISDNNLIIYDSSGYQNNSILNSNITISSDTARYKTSSYFGNYNEPNTILQNTNILSALSNCTICWWGKYDTTKTLLLTGQNTSTYLAASNANTFYHAAAGSPVMYKNGVQGTYSCTAGTWDFYVLKNVNLSSWTAMKINSYSSEWPLKGYISDFRIYATALTDDQVKELYDTSVTIDNLGNVHVRELIEN